VRYFDRVGKVVAARVVRDPGSGHSRGFGFIGFEREEDVKRVRAGVAGAGGHGEFAGRGHAETGSPSCALSLSAPAPPHLVLSLHPTPHPPAPQAIDKMHGDEIHGRKVAVQAAKTQLY
jgi:RNA recognition motif-containing protein